MRIALLWWIILQYYCEGCIYNYSKLPFLELSFDSFEACAPTLEPRTTLDKSLHRSWQTTDCWTTFVRYCWQRPNVQLNFSKLRWKSTREHDYTWNTGKTDVWLHELSHTGRLEVQRAEKWGETAITVASYTIQNKIRILPRGLLWTLMIYQHRYQTTWHTSVHVVTNYPARGMLSKECVFNLCYSQDSVHLMLKST